MAQWCLPIVWLSVLILLKERKREDHAEELSFLLSVMVAFIAIKMLYNTYHIEYMYFWHVLSLILLCIVFPCIASWIIQALGFSKKVLNINELNNK